MAPPVLEEDNLRIVVIHRLPAFNYPLASRLQSQFHLIDPLTAPSTTSTAALLDSARVLLCLGPSPLNENTLSLYPSIQLVVGTSAGLNHFDLAACARRGVTVTDTGYAFSEDVADCAVGLLIDVLRKISAGDGFVRRGLWPVQGGYPLGFKVGGRRVGILGLGRIGSEIAKRVAALGCSVAYNSRKKKHSVPFPYYENIHDLATNSDVLVLCCALTDQTRHIVNRDVMTALGKEGVIINVGRGGLIHQEEMVRFLVRGELLGAGLDVFEDEPNVPKELLGAGLDVFEDEPNVPKELRELDNVVLSPHAAVLTAESFEALQDVIYGNLDAFFSNKPLISPVQNY